MMTALARRETTKYSSAWTALPREMTISVASTATAAEM